MSAARQRTGERDRRTAGAGDCALCQAQRLRPHRHGRARPARRAEGAARQPDLGGAGAYDHSGAAGPVARAGPSAFRHCRCGGARRVELEVAGVGVRAQIDIPRCHRGRAQPSSRVPAALRDHRSGPRWGRAAPSVFNAAPLRSVLLPAPWRGRGDGPPSSGRGRWRRGRGSRRPWRGSSGRTASSSVRAADRPRLGRNGR